MLVVLFETNEAKPTSRSLSPLSTSLRPLVSMPRLAGAARLGGTLDSQRGTRGKWFYNTPSKESSLATQTLLFCPAANIFLVEAIETAAFPPLGIQAKLSSRLYAPKELIGWV